MRQNNSFVSGMLAGMAMGAMMVIAFTPQVRRPMMNGMGQMMNGRMRGMMRKGADMASSMMPGDDAE